MEKGKEGICIHCEYEGLVFDSSTQNVTLCDLCHSTYLGNNYLYPNSYTFTTPEMLAQAINWLNKQITKKINEQTTRPRRPVARKSSKPKSRTKTNRKKPSKKA